MFHIIYAATYRGPKKTFNSLLPPCLMKIPTETHSYVHIFYAFTCYMWTLVRIRAQQLARWWTWSCCRWPRCWTRRQMNRRSPQETRYSLTPSLIYWSHSTHPPMLSKLWAFYLFFKKIPSILFFCCGHSSSTLYDAGYQFHSFLFSSWWHLARLLYARQEMSWWWWWMKARSSFDSPS